MIDHPRKLGLRGYFQSPTIRELVRLLVARAFIGTNTLGTHPGQEASLQADECAALVRDGSLLIEEAVCGAVVGKSGELDDDLAAYPLLRNLPQFAPLFYIRPCTLAEKEQPMLSFVNTELLQVPPDLLQAVSLTRVDWLIEPMPMEYAYAQCHEWTIS